MLPRDPLILTLARAPQTLRPQGNGWSRLSSISLSHLPNPIPSGTISYLFLRRHIRSCQRRARKGYKTSVRDALQLDHTFAVNGETVAQSK